MDNINTNNNIEKILVEDFVKEYKATPDSRRSLFCKNAIYRSYVPVLEKYVALSMAFNRTCRNTNGLIQFNSFLEYLVYTMTTIKMYTRLSIGTEENSSIIDAYDALQECGALKELLLAIGENELEELGRIHDRILNDVQVNELSPHAYFAEQIGRFKDAVNMVIDEIGKENTGADLGVWKTVFSSAEKPENRNVEIDEDDGK